MNLKARAADCGKPLAADSSPREKAKQTTPKPRADGSWDRQGGTNSSRRHLSRCPLTAPSVVTASTWAQLLGGGQPGPQLACCSMSQGCTTAKALPLHLSRSMFTAPASHSFREIRFLFCPCVPCSSDSGVCKTAGWSEKKCQFDPHTVAGLAKSPRLPELQFSALSRREGASSGGSCGPF